MLFFAANTSAILAAVAVDTAILLLLLAATTTTTISSITANYCDRLLVVLCCSIAPATVPLHCCRLRGSQCVLLADTLNTKAADEVAVIHDVAQ